MTFLREETQRHGFPTPDGVHNGPCHVHMKHAHTIGPDGSLYACPGFTGEQATSTGHIDDRRDAVARIARASSSTDSVPGRNAATARSSRCVPGDASWRRTRQLGDMNMPTCHKRSFESALISLAHDVASAA